MFMRNVLMSVLVIARVRPQSIFPEPTHGADQFCDEEVPNNLVDLVFNYKDFVYAFRNPNNFWILQYRENTWQQMYGPLRKSDLFENMPDDRQIDSVLSIWNYNKCSPTSGQCRNDYRYLNPTNITFVFSGDNYYIYRRISDHLFVEVDARERMIPWGAQVSTSQMPIQAIKEILKTMDPPIIISVFVPPIIPDNEFAVFLTQDYIYEYNIIDRAMDYHDLRIELPRWVRISEKHGAIYHQDKVFIFFSNKVYEHMTGGDAMTPTGRTYWQFFKCDQMKATSTIAVSTASITKVSSSTTSSSTTSTSTTSTSTTSTPTTSTLTTSTSTSSTIVTTSVSSTDTPVSEIADTETTERTQDSELDTSMNWWTTEVNNNTTDEITNERTEPTKGRTTQSDADKTSTTQLINKNSPDLTNDTTHDFVITSSEGSDSKVVESVKKEINLIQTEDHTLIRSLSIVLFAMVLTIALMITLLVCFGYLILSEELIQK